jgi:muconate cycloisomerase
MDVGTKSYTSHQEAKMTATVERIESWIVDVPTIRPHKLSMTTMGCQTLVIVRLTRSDGICGIGEATTIGGLSYGVESGGHLVGDNALPDAAVERAAGR